MDDEQVVHFQWLEFILKQISTLNSNVYLITWNQCHSINQKLGKNSNRSFKIIQKRKCHKKPKHRNYFSIHFFLHFSKTNYRCRYVGT